MELLAGLLDLVCCFAAFSAAWSSFLKLSTRDGLVAAAAADDDLPAALLIPPLGDRFAGMLLVVAAVVVVVAVVVVWLSCWLT